MSQSEVSAREILKDVRAGMDDARLMEKYRLSSTALQNLFQKLVEAGLLRREGAGFTLPNKRKIPASRIVKDIRSGMSSAELMEKYDLTERGVQRVCRELLSARALAPEEYQPEISFQSTMVMRTNIRELERYHVDFDLPVYESSSPEIQGKVRDITEKGVGLVGIDSEAYETKTLVILGDYFGEISPFEFRADCRWSRRQPPSNKCFAGFRITEISRESLRELKRLIQLVALRGLD